MPVEFPFVDIWIRVVVDYNLLILRGRSEISKEKYKKKAARFSIQFISFLSRRESTVFRSNFVSIPLQSIKTHSIVDVWFLNFHVLYCS